MLQNLRQAMRRQLRRHPARRGNPSFSRRNTPLWMRAFRGGTPATDLDLDPPGSAQAALGPRSYQSTGAEGRRFGPCSGGGAGEAALLPECFAMVDLQQFSLERRAPPSSSRPERELSGVGSRAWSRPASRSEPPGRPQGGSSAHNGPPPTIREVSQMCRKRIPRKLVLELAVNLRGVSLKRYSSLGPLAPLSPLSPQPQTSTSTCHSRGQEASSSPGPSSSVTGEDSVTVDVPPRERGGGDGRWRDGKSQGGLCSFNRGFNDEEGDSGTETTPC